MSIENNLLHIVGQIALRTKNRASYIHQEYLDAQKLAMDKKAEFDLADSALKRAANFQVKIGTNYQCPNCWIERGIRSDLRPIPSQTRDDVLRCQNGHEHTILH